jgi:hypothetical protein
MRDNRQSRDRLGNSVDERKPSKVHDQISHPIDPGLRDSGDALHELTERAIEVFGDERVALDWLNTPHPLLQNGKPVDSARRVVEDLLIRIEHGIFS